MKHLVLAALIGGATTFAAQPAFAAEQIVTPASPAGWAPSNVRSGGTVAIDSQRPKDGGGSLSFSTVSGDSKADFVNTWGIVAGRTLGNISDLSYSYFRDASSTTAAILAPAFRLAYFDQASNASGYLIYEPTYQGSGNQAVPTGTWISADIGGANFWQRAFGPGRTIERYDITLQQWASGTQAAANSHVLSANTFIYGIEVGVGSGWTGTFSGAVDNVNIAFGTDRVSANFEPNAAVGAVPEPSTWAMMLVGFGAVGFSMRRRKSAKGRGMQPA